MRYGIIVAHPRLIFNARLVEPAGRWYTEPVAAWPSPLSATNNPPAVLISMARGRNSRCVPWTAAETAPFQFTRKNGWLTCGSSGTAGTGPLIARNAGRARPAAPRAGTPVRKLWQWSALPLAGCAVVAVFIAVMQITLAASTEAGMPADTGYILIDPGHGGADGGAQAADGTLEKDINLAVALPLNDMLKVCGYPVKMTRDTDISVHSDSARTLREQKVSDMHNRLALYDKAKAAVGIHTNKFPQTQYFGTQLFYSANCPESEGIASAIRESVVGLLQPKNTREMKKADSNIFLLDKAKVPRCSWNAAFCPTRGSWPS